MDITKYKSQRLRRGKEIPGKTKRGRRMMGRNKVEYNTMLILVNFDDYELMKTIVLAHS